MWCQFLFLCIIVTCIFSTWHKKEQKDRKHVSFPCDRIDMRSSTLLGCSRLVPHLVYFQTTEDAFLRSSFVVLHISEASNIFFGGGFRSFVLVHRVSHDATIFVTKSHSATKLCSSHHCQLRDTKNICSYSIDKNEHRVILKMLPLSRHY